MEIKKAIIPVAGFGTRMFPLTKTIPKEMLPVYNRPAIQYIIEEAVDSGIEKILLITRGDKDSIEDHFDIQNHWLNRLSGKQKDEEHRIRCILDRCNIFYKRQGEIKGLGHAILQGASFVDDEYFAVLLGDDVIYDEDPCIGQLIRVFEKYQSSIIGTKRVSKNEVFKYGVIDGVEKEKGITQIHEIIEKPSVEATKNNLVTQGRYILSPKIFEILKKIKPGVDDEIQLTDALDQLAKKESMYSYEFKGKRYDLGNELGILKAFIEFALRDRTNREQTKNYLKELHEKHYEI
ncbi:MAG: UTP--glucose-1-phosphate uridylyltransferase GalU [Tissierellia bacterium]|nr:UTP--glucose-1-phosphate uridylyltransferase GalU [Tissierellia bacterium]